MDIVARLIKSTHLSARIRCVDLTPKVLEVLKGHVAEHKWDGVETEVLDVRDLKTFKDETFSHVLTKFGFAPTPDDLDRPTKAAAEMFRAFKKGGAK